MEQSVAINKGNRSKALTLNTVHTHLTLLETSNLKKKKKKRDKVTLNSHFASTAHILFSWISDLIFDSEDFPAAFQDLHHTSMPFVQYFCSFECLKTVLVVWKWRHVLLDPLCDMKAHKKFEATRTDETASYGYVGWSLTYTGCYTPGMQYHSNHTEREGSQRPLGDIDISLPERLQQFNSGNRKQHTAEAQSLGHFYFQCRISFWYEWVLRL